MTAPAEFIPPTTRTGRGLRVAAGVVFNLANLAVILFLVSRLSPRRRLSLY